MIKKTSFQLEAQSPLPTKFGDFTIMSFADGNDTHIALTMGSRKQLQDPNNPVLVRIHSKCLTGDVFSSLRCDCQSQLNKAMQLIAKQKVGVLLYMDQEGRGIGISAKIKAYALQINEGLDTDEANKKLGFNSDLRQYEPCVTMLQHIGVVNIKLLTNNPNKSAALKQHFTVTTQQHIGDITADNEDYLKVKRDKYKHNIH